MSYQDNQQGRSMIEVMGYMAAVMAIVAGVSKIVSNTYSEYKLSQANVQLSELAGAILKSSAVEANYKNIVNMVNGKSSATLNKEGLKLIPKSYKVVKTSSGNKIFNVFGGEVKVGIPNNAEEAKDKFYISFAGLDREQCIEMAMKEWHTNKVVDLYSMIVNGNYWYWPVYAEATNGVSELPATRSVLAGKDVNDNGQCNKNSGNLIMWVFN